MVRDVGSSCSKEIFLGENLYLSLINPLKFVGVSSVRTRINIDALAAIQMGNSSSLPPCMCMKNLWLSSGIFDNFRKTIGNAREVFGQLLEYLRKSLENGRRFAEKRRKRRYQYIYTSLRIHECLLSHYLSVSM